MEPTGIKPGNLVKLSNKGQPVRVIPDMDPRPLENVTEHEPGTLAMILEIWASDHRDGPSMDSYARVMVGGNTGYVWLYECEVIDEDR
jgi:hypothetical protein